MNSNIGSNFKGDVKLIDFGMFRIDTGDHENSMLDMCGTPHYLSPEMIRLNPHSYTTDVWSFGVMILELMQKEDMQPRDPLPYMYKVGSGTFKILIERNSQSSSQTSSHHACDSIPLPAHHSRNWCDMHGSRKLAIKISFATW
mgnify:CR=1 FL=1